MSARGSNQVTAPVASNGSVGVGLSCYDSARRFLDRLSDHPHVFGFSDGTFSAHDLVLDAVKRLPGAPSVDLMSWTGYIPAIKALDDAKTRDEVTRVRFIFNHRLLTQAYKHKTYAAVITRFGASAMRFLDTHAKTYLVNSGEGAILITGSGNLNRNSNIEAYFVTRDPAPCQHVEAFFDKVFDAYDHDKFPSDRDLRRAKDAVKDTPKRSDGADSLDFDIDLDLDLDLDL